MSSTLVRPIRLFKIGCIIQVRRVFSRPRPFRLSRSTNWSTIARMLGDPVRRPKCRRCLPTQLSDKSAKHPDHGNEEHTPGVFLFLCKLAPGVIGTAFLSLQDRKPGCQRKSINTSIPTFSHTCNLSPPTVSLLHDGPEHERHSASGPCATSASGRLH